MGELFCNQHKIWLALMASSLGKLFFSSGEITIGESGNKGDFLPVLLWLTPGLAIYVSCSFLSLAPLAAPSNSDASS